VHFAVTHGLKARPLALVGYGEEDEGDSAADGASREGAPA
jgi:hypothetical protein